MSQPLFQTLPQSKTAKLRLGNKESMRKKYYQSSSFHKKGFLSSCHRMSQFGNDHSRIFGFVKQFSLCIDQNNDILRNLSINAQLPWNKSIKRIEKTIKYQVIMESMILMLQGDFLDFSLRKSFLGASKHEKSLNLKI